MNEPVESLSRAQEYALRYAADFAPRLVAAALVLVAGWFITGWVVRILRNGLARFELEPPVRHLLERVVRVLLLALAFMVALQNLGVELLPLVAGLGIAGAGIALAMQGVLSNVAAGLIIIFTKPFRVGEYVSIAGVEGEVVSISLFSTVLRHADLSSVVVPNRKISGEILHNYGAIRQLELGVRVGYDQDLDAAARTVREVLGASPRVLAEPAPLVLVAALGDSGVEIAAKPWVRVPDYGAATGELNRALVEAFRARGIAIPPPRQEVRLLPAAND
ncbi:MAG: mechanosensitive ion channel family protein [Steroidobacteraceae bacterium]